MSGHNKWSTIKHTKAKNDAANAKVFTKILRELTVAVKEGGTDPNSNARLRAILTKARSNNVPNDNIQRVIKKASGETGSVEYYSITYEGYGVGGSAVIVKALTDNKNRTASEVRYAFDKHNGSLGTTNSVSYLFNRQGEIIIAKETGFSDDEITEHTLESGADDVEIYNEYFKIVVSPDNFDNVKEYFDKNNILYLDASINLVASNNITLSSDQEKLFVKMIDILEDNDDVQEVFHNVILSEDETE